LPGGGGLDPPLFDGIKIGGSAICVIHRCLLHGLLTAFIPAPAPLSSALLRCGWTAGTQVYYGRIALSAWYSREVAAPVNTWNAHGAGSAASAMVPSQLLGRCRITQCSGGGDAACITAALGRGSAHDPPRSMTPHVQKRCPVQQPVLVKLCPLGCATT